MNIFSKTVKITDKKLGTLSLTMSLILCFMLPTFALKYTPGTEIIHGNGFSGLHLSSEEENTPQFSPIFASQATENFGVNFGIYSNKVNFNKDSSAKNLNFSDNATNAPTYFGDNSESEQAYYGNLNIDKSSFALDASYIKLGAKFTNITEIKNDTSAADKGFLNAGQTTIRSNVTYKGIKNLTVTNSVLFTDTSELESKSADSITTKLTYAPSSRFSAGFAVKESYSRNLIDNSTAFERANDLSLSAKPFHEKNTFTLTANEKERGITDTVEEDYLNAKATISIKSIRDVTLTAEHVNNNDFLTKYNISRNNAAYSQTLKKGKLSFNLAEDWTTSSVDENYQVGYSRMTAAVDNVKLDRLSLNSNFLSEVTTNTPEKTHVTNIQAKLKAIYRFSSSLTLTSELTSKETNNDGNSSIYDNLINWKATKNRIASFQYYSNNNSLTGLSTLSKFTVSEKLSNLHNLEATMREDTAGETIGTREELAYSYTLKNNAKITARGGIYNLNAPQGEKSGNLASLELRGYKLHKDVSVTLGAYTGPQLGGGYLSYRSWGERVSGNLGVWNDDDFKDYTEIGGELTYDISKKTRLTLKGYLAEIGTEERETTDITVTHKLDDKSTITLRQENMNSNVIADTHLSSAKVSLFEKELPKWAKESTNKILFADGNTLGFARALTWQKINLKAGLSYELRQYIENEKELERHTATISHMFGKKYFVQAIYDKNPADINDLSITSLSTRYSLQFGAAIDENSSVFVRKTKEDYVLSNDLTNIYTAGLIGNISKEHRYQFEVNHNNNTTGNAKVSGFTYIAQYENIISNNESLFFKLNLSPQELVKDDVSYARKFELAYTVKY